jgi:hypothetical protein
VLRPGGIVVLRSNNEDDGDSRLDHLAAVFARAGFTIRRASHANCLPALAAQLRARLQRGNPDGGHPAGGGLRIRMPHPLVNRLMGAVAAVEAFAVGRLAARLPFGHSTMILGQGGHDANRL